MSPPAAIRTAHAGLAAWLAILPGLFLCTGVAAVAVALQSLETRLFGRAWLEALVIAILLGAAIRSMWSPHLRFERGVAFSSKILLEVSIVLLGAAVSARMILGAGLALPGAVMILVGAAIAASYGLGRAFGLPHRLAALIACGNSICGNSAIAAVAPVIGAEGEEVAASIAFTAVLGVLVVLILPPAAGLLGLSPKAFGVLAGLTVYAVPQVLPATSVVSPVAVQMGVLVKLMRVLMLGPVIFAVSVAGRRGAASPGPGRTGMVRLSQLAPWFIVGFGLMAAARSLGAIPDAAAHYANGVAAALTIVSMAAMGLGVDVRSVAGAGLRVTTVAALSLAVLAGLALVLIRLLGVV